MFVHQGIKHGYKIGQLELPLMIWHRGMRGKRQLNSMTMYFLIEAVFQLRANALQFSR